MAPTLFVLLAARAVVTGGQEPELPGAGAVKRKEGGTTRRSLPPSVVRSVSFLDLVLPRPSDRPTFGRRQWRRRRRPMNGSGGGGVGGGEPVTWIVLHWQRCTVAPAAVAMAATAAAAAVESAAPRMQKMVGRRLLPSPPLLRPVHRATERLPQRMRVWLGAGNGCGARSLARPLACHRFDQFQLPSPLAAPSVFPWVSSSVLLFPLLFSYSPPSGLARLSLRLFAVSCGAGPLAATGATERGAATLRIIQSCNALWTHAPTRAVNLLTIYSLSLRNMMSGVCRWFL